MKRFRCTCGNTLFFESSICLNCRRSVGWCPVCRQISPLDPAAGNGFVCGNPECLAPLLKCDNFFTQDVCNRCVRIEGAANPPLCDYCRFNHVVPDLSVAGNRQKWAKIETAKRRVLYDFDSLGLPYGTAGDGVVPPLRFDFKGDIITGNPATREMSNGDKVLTGHEDGLITINLKEADDVQREALRVMYHETHRTLIGHFRHEMGHYVWDVAVKGQREAECVALFGDHTAPYEEALKAYYANGPKRNWTDSFVSAYATMHPWEDFAETFANYLDLMATLETASVGGLPVQLPGPKFEPCATGYVGIGMTLNELNRCIGLPDFLPEVIVEPVSRKMGFVHSLTRFGRK